MNCNIYDDLGRPDADAMLYKARLVRALELVIREHHLTTAQAALRLGITRERLDSILSGRFRLERAEWITVCLKKLGHAVVSVDPQPPVTGRGEFKLIPPLLFQ